MTSEKLGRQKIRKIEKLLYERAKEKELTLEKDTYFKDTTYLNIRDKNDPKKRIYIEAGHFHLFEGISVIQYYDGRQTTYSNNFHEVKDVVDYVLHSLKNFNKRPVSGAARPPKSVQEHFSKWEEVK